MRFRYLKIDLFLKILQLILNQFVKAKFTIVKIHVVYSVCTLRYNLLKR